MTNAAITKATLGLATIFNQLMLILSQLTLLDLVITVPGSWVYLLQGFVFAVVGLTLTLHVRYGKQFLGAIILILFAGLILMSDPAPGTDSTFELFVKAVFAMTPWALIALAIVYFKKIPQYVITASIVLYLPGLVNWQIKRAQRYMSVHQLKVLLNLLSRFGNESNARAFLSLPGTGDIEPLTWDKAITNAEDSGNTTVAKVWADRPRKNVY
jgi:hypothetical protein